MNHLLKTGPVVRALRPAPPGASEGGRDELALPHSECLVGLVVH